MAELTVTRTVVVTNDEGLHARAATLVAELVRRYESGVKLSKDGEKVEGTEVLQILSLGVAQGEQLVLEATGRDAVEVLDALAQLFAGNFSEDVPEAEEKES